MDKNGKNNVSIRLDKTFFDSLHKKASEHNQTLSAYIKAVLYEKIKEDK